MTRNPIPKLNEWRNGCLFQFVAERDGNVIMVEPDNMAMIVYRVVRSNLKTQKLENETLATCYADGFEECLAAMYHQGFNKGVLHGERQKLELIRDVLGIPHQKDTIDD